MISEREAVAFLLQCGYVSPADVVERGVRASVISRRHPNVAVIVRNGAGFLLKVGTGAEGIGSVNHEASTLGLLEQVDAERLGGCLPVRLGYHSDEDILVLDYVPDARDLQAEFLRHRRCSPALAGRLGDALARLHSLPGADGTGWPEVHVHRSPWVMSLHRPRPELLRELSLASRHLITVLQGDRAFCQGLDELRDMWRPESLVHFDVKWDNCIVFPLVPTPSGLRLIDWEFGGVGDARWDIGSVLAAYLAHWLASVPFVPSAADPPVLEPVTDLARHPIGAMQGSIRAFWSAYVKRTGHGTDADTARLSDSFRFAAARLVQTAYETSQGLTRPDPFVGGLLQMASNLLQGETEPLCDLLGLSPAGVEP